MAEPQRQGDASPGDPTRRDFLRVGAGASLGMAVPGLGRSLDRFSTEKSLILLNLVGGPSQLETFDPKPEAPSEIRGPFGSIPTRLPGVRVSEHLPRLAARMDRLAIIRSVHHEAAPIHETGLQLLQTGRLARLGDESPHVGSVVSACLGAWQGAPPSVILPGPIGNTGVGISRGQTAGPLGSSHEPLFLDPEASAPREGLSRRVRQAMDLSEARPAMRESYGLTPFGENCLRARRLIEAGVRVVTVNMFTTVFHQVSWDCHAQGPFSTLEDYRRELLPTLDLALSGLIDDLERTGLLERTLVLAAGEFGRSPRLNASGGRDHWPAAWSVAMAGGGISGGTIIGATDAKGAEPVDRPVTPAEILATIHGFLGIALDRPLQSTEGQTFTPTPGAAPIAGLLG